MQEIGPFLPSIDQSELKIGSQDGNDEAGNTASRTHIDDSVGLWFEGFHETPGVLDDLGNRTRTEHSLPLGFSQHRLEHEAHLLGGTDHHTPEGVVALRASLHIVSYSQGVVDHLAIGRRHGLQHSCGS
jgi:hypothetical protein